MSERRLVVLVALAIFVADLVTKQIMLGLCSIHRADRGDAVSELCSGMESGISFGILADAGGAVPALLTALAIAVTAWLVWKAPQFGRSSVLARV